MAADEEDGEEEGGEGEVQADEGEKAQLVLPPFEPLAGHKLVAWGATILCFGGHTKVLACPHSTQ